MRWTPGGRGSGAWGTRFGGEWVSCEVLCSDVEAGCSELKERGEWGDGDDSN